MYGTGNFNVKCKECKKKLNFINHKSKRKPLFVNYPISNYDIIEWVKYLKIKNIKGVFSRDNVKGTIKKPECGIINLDDIIGPGKHWVCYYSNYYFNHFWNASPYRSYKIY